MASIDAEMSARLKEALTAGHPEAVQALIRDGLDLNGKTPARETPLSLALGGMHWEIAAALLAAGASPKGVEVGNYYPPLAWVCIYGQPALVQALLRAGASVTERDRFERLPLQWAAERNQLETTRLLLDAGADPNAGSKYMAPPLFSACRRGDLALARQLVEAGARPDLTESYRNTPLHLAAASANPELLSWLIGLGAYADALNDLNQNPLHLAAQAGQARNARLLLDHGANPRRRDKHGQTPLTLSTYAGNSETFDLLKAVSPEPSPADRVLCLKQTLRRQDPGLLRRVMSWFDLSAPLDEHHPLMVAIGLGLWPMVQTLLQGGIDPDAEVDGLPLLRWSMARFLPELARLLMAAGARQGRDAAIAWLDNLILLRKSGQVLLAPGTATQPLDDRYLLALQKNIESLGFVLTQDLAERVMSLNEAELASFYALLIPSLRALVGAHQAFKPMYPDFPAGVKAMPERELYLNAMLHYWGDLIGRRIMPALTGKARPALSEAVKLKPVGLAGPEALPQLFGRLLQARSALRLEDKQDLSWFVSSRGDAVAPWLPDEIPIRENAALLAAALLRHTRLPAEGYLKQGVDVLRVATALCDGDVSLAENTRFYGFPKARRRWLLAGLEARPDLAEALWRHPEKFKRLGEQLHPGEYKSRYPKTWQAFAQLRAGIRPESFGRSVETALAAADVRASLALLRTRPGVLARRLDHLLRLSDPAETEAVLSEFAGLVGQLPTPLTLQLMSHFQHRLAPGDLRVFFPKGEVAKLAAIDNQLAPIEAGVCARVATLCRQALLTQFRQRPPLGKAWLDPALRSYTVPFALRSAAKALRTVGRGSRIGFGDPLAESQEVVRFFIWWRDGKDRTDIDLSALALNADFGYETTLSYYNLVDFGGCHSGDITSAPEGAAEFIDIEVAACLERGVRYVLMVVNSYTSQPYCDLPECFAGFMLRRDADSGEIFEPRTVLNKFDLTANTTIAFPMILDLQTREVLWTDLALKRNPSHVNNVHGNRSSLSLLAQAMVNLRRPSLYELFELQIDARGERVYDQEQAETVFGLEQGITPYDIPQILSDFL